MIILMQSKKQKINYEQNSWITQRKKRYFKRINILDLEALKNCYSSCITMK